MPSVLNRIHTRLEAFWVAHWIPWKRLLLLSFLGGLVLAIATAFDFNGFAAIVAFLVTFVLHLSIAALLAGTLVAFRTGERWALPWWVLGTALLGLVTYFIDDFVVAQVSMSDTFDRFFIAAAIVTVGAGFVLTWTRTDWVMTDLRDLAWDVMSIVSGLIIGISVVVALIANWADDRQTDIDSQIPNIPVVADIAGKYVALGDSYSAGEGITPFQPGSPRNCDRSPQAYPLLLEFEQEVSVTFEACSGAVTQDVDIGVVGGAPPQIAPGTDDEVKLVTITIGGNDVVFSDIVTHCFRYEDCLDRTFTPRPPHPGRETIAYPEPQELDAWTQAALVLLGANVDRVFSRIEAAYPEARVVVLGYPNLFPTGNAPWLWDQIDCASVLRRVDKDEREALHGRVADLNSSLYDLAVEHDFDFISPTYEWEGHEACGNDGQYTNAVKPGRQLANPVDGATLHPNIRGQQQYARLIACYLNSTPETPEPAAAPPGSDEGSKIDCGL